MNGSRERRPHFLYPPVVEVVCGVQFPPLNDWLTAHYGRYWIEVRSKYPHLEDHPPLPKLRLEAENVPEEALLSVVPPLRRVFYITDPPNYLIQVQPNRFLHNWRKLSLKDRYPRFEEAYSGFLREWQRFLDFLNTENLTIPRPEMYELSYINHISGKDATYPRDVWKFLSFYERNPTSEPRFEATNMFIDFGWPLSSDAGTLRMTVRHGRSREDNREVLVVELNARGRARQELPMDRWFTIAHDAIVNSFDKLTTEEAHSLWEKQA